MLERAYLSQPARGHPRLACTWHGTGRERGGVHQGWLPASREAASQPQCRERSERQTQSRGAPNFLTPRHVPCTSRRVTRKLIDDELQVAIEPMPRAHSPVTARHPRPEGRRGPEGTGSFALIGIVLVLRTGILREDLPQELGCCGMTCWKRPCVRQHAWVWQRVHQCLLSGCSGRMRSTGRRRS